MKSNYTHIRVVVDRSGSMARCAADMRGALDEFFKSQAELPGKCLVDYVEFDDKYEVVYESKPVYACKATLKPRGMTALTDAFGKSIAQLGEKLRDMNEKDRPDKVIVVVVTDGGENASKEYTADQVKKMVKHQTDKYNWEFVFLGANMDAVATGAGYGLNMGQTMTYDVANTAASVGSLSTYVGTTRTVGHAAFSDEDRKNAIKTKK